MLNLIHKFMKSLQSGSGGGVGKRARSVRNAKPESRHEASGESAKPARARRRMHVVSNTHWDREHRHGFQETRLMLAGMMDRLLDILEADPTFARYVLDAQFVMVDDYLELKPQRRARLEKLAREGRILVGPWYSLVDASSVTHECLVRNLVVGCRRTRELGAEPMKFGYSVFSFGQVAQLPQIYAGFGIHDLIFYKGADKAALKKSEFLWEAPDGTRALASRLGKFHRVNFFWRFTIPCILGGDPDAPGEWASTYTNGMRLCHMADPHFRMQSALEIDRDIRIRPERLRKGVEDTIACAEPDTLCPESLLFFDGLDFSTPLAEMPEALRQANAAIGDLGELVQSTPMDYFRELRAALDLSKLHVHRGDLRAGPVDHVHTESMGANIEILRALGRAERTLIHVAEPFGAWASALGAQYPHEATDLCWRYLFQVHAHDSAHALGDPKIKRDSLSRLDQAQEIADGLSRRAIENIVARIDTSEAAADDIFLAVFNPSPVARGGVLEVVVDIPLEEHARGWWLETLEGERLEHWQIERRQVSVGMVSPENRPKPVDADRFLAEVRFPEIPGFGYRVFRVRREKSDRPPGAEIFSSGQFPDNPIGSGARVLDNGILRAEVGACGTITLTSSATGEVFPGLLELLDTGCRGDCWVHHAPNRDARISSVGATRSIRMTANSALRAAIEIRAVMEIPESLAEGREARSGHVVPTEIVTEIALEAGSPRLDVRVSFDNRSRDHFLRARIPTGIDTTKCRADSPFNIRALDFESSGRHGLRGPELAREAMSSFVDVAGGGRSLAVFSRTGKEFGIDNSDGRGVVELSLLRATDGAFPIDEHTFMDYGDPFSQCLGPQVFEFAIQPHCGSGEEIPRAAFEYLNPLIAAEFGKGRLPGTLPLPSASFLSLDRGILQFSCVKPSEDGFGWVVRLFNPFSHEVRDTLRTAIPAASALPLRLDETPDGAPVPAAPDGAFPLRVPAGKILTLLLAPIP